MAPKIIRSELDEGVTTWVPYGISVDVSSWIDELRDQCEKLVEEFKQNEGHLPPPSLPHPAK